MDLTGCDLMAFLNVSAVDDAEGEFLASIAIQC